MRESISAALRRGIRVLQVDDVFFSMLQLVLDLLRDEHVLQERVALANCGQYLCEVESCVDSVASLLVQFRQFVSMRPFEAGTAAVV